MRICATRKTCCGSLFGMIFPWERGCWANRLCRGSRCSTGRVALCIYSVPDKYQLVSSGKNPAASLSHTWLANLGTNPISNYVRETAAPMRSSCTCATVEPQSGRLFGNVSYGFLHFSSWCSEDVCFPGKSTGSPRFDSMHCFIWLSKKLRK